MGPNYTFNFVLDKGANSIRDPYTLPILLTSQMTKGRLFNMKGYNV